VICEALSLQLNDVDAFPKLDDFVLCLVIDEAGTAHTRTGSTNLYGVHVDKIHNTGSDHSE
jgi:hypothetical protein